jgi:hypothetical protein
MSHDDHRSDSRDRGAYTPPTDDDLPFNRSGGGGGFDARRGSPAKAPPVTLIISGVVLLALIVAVVVIYNMSGPKASKDAPSIGDPVGELKVESPIEAQPVDPEAGIEVFRGDAEPAGTAPNFTAPPEEVQPRPAPRPLPSDAPALAPAPTPKPTAPVATAPATPAPAPSTATGTSAVQIGAFSSTAVADREFASVAARFPQFSRGSAKRVQEVTASNGTTVYRTTFTGLSRERAQAFCAAIRAGGGDCLVR